MKLRALDEVVTQAQHLRVDRQKNRMQDEIICIAVA
jgi:hypothetical protein